MCGICGFVGAPAPESLLRMTEALARRGPDGQGVWTSSQGDVSFGHRRLSIVDLGGGAQPMTSHDGRFTITFNGEIYNHVELRSELERLGAQFRTSHSDTEVLLEGFRAWGNRIEQKLNGMWAFALYDRENRVLRLSRDRVGKKPLYYAETNEGLVFASDLRSLSRHPKLANPTLSPLSVQKYFGYGYIPAPRTIFEGVYKLPGGHTLEYDVSSRSLGRIRAYWTYTPRQEVETAKSFADGVEQLRVVLQAAVKRRLEADVPVGVFLSGGIDSSAVAALAARERPAGEIKTFSIGFTEPSFDESAFAQTVASFLGTDHHLDKLSMEKARELLPGLGEVLDEPIADSSILPTQLLSLFARNQVKVALGGDGGDELFAGYDPFLALKRAQAYQRWVSKPMHQAVLAVASCLPVSHRNMSFDFRLKRTLRGLGHAPSRWLPVWMAPLGDSEGRDAGLFTFPLEEIFSEAIECWDRHPEENAIERTVRFYLELYLQNDILTKVDRASMHHGLEVRAPFLDREVIELARQMPASWKLNHGRTKHVLKEALRGLLPQSIIDRNKKGFGVPIGAWFQSGALSLAADKAWNPDLARRLLATHQAGKSDERAYLWCEWVLAAWKDPR